MEQLVAIREWVAQGYLGSRSQTSAQRQRAQRDNTDSTGNLPNLRPNLPAQQPNMNSSDVGVLKCAAPSWSRKAALEKCQAPNSPNPRYKRLFVPRTHPLLKGMQGPQSRGNGGKPSSSTNGFLGSGGLDCWAVSRV